jgi:hypothetical protein
VCSIPFGVVVDNWIPVKSTSTVIVRSLISALITLPSCARRLKSLYAITSLCSVASQEWNMNVVKIAQRKYAI